MKTALCFNFPKTKGQEALTTKPGMLLTKTRRCCSGDIRLFSPVVTARYLVRCKQISFQLDFQRLVGIFIAVIIREVYFYFSLTVALQSSLSRDELYLKLEVHFTSFQARLDIIRSQKILLKLTSNSSRKNSKLHFFSKQKKLLTLGRPKEFLMIYFKIFHRNISDV